MPLEPPEGPVAGLESASDRYLDAQLQRIERRVRALARRRRDSDPHPDDDFRGLYLADVDIDAILAEDGARRDLAVGRGDDVDTVVEGRADADETAGADVRLRRLSRNFGLDHVDVDVLLAALLPDLDRSFERLYGYLNDDVGQRRLTVELAIHLTGESPRRSAPRERFAAPAPLLAGGLIEVGTLGPFLGRSVTVPDRVGTYLLGSDAADALVRPVLEESTKGWGGDEVAAALVAGISCIYLRESIWPVGRAVAVDGAHLSNRDAVVIDLARLGAQGQPAVVAAAAVRECRLRGGVLVAGPVDVVVASPQILDILTAPPTDVVLTGRCHWDAAWTRRRPFTMAAPAPSAVEQAKIWADGLPAGVDNHGRLATLMLGPDAVARAVDDALARAALEKSRLSIDHILEGARNQSATGLERLARRIKPSVSLDDMVLRSSVRELLDDLVSRARHRGTVIDEWGMRPGTGRGRGVTALLTGPPGTGKTMAAEALAHELGIDLYVVDMATVVDKYIGETEKNLERIFSEGDGVNAILLFDEADALFGKRTNIGDAHDRYANLEISFLLHRMESFNGLAFLSTNLRANLDDALVRRLDISIDFPMPDEHERQVLWERCLGGDVPRDSDLDLAACAHTYELSGSSIRSVAIGAAYRAAAGARCVTMNDLLVSARQEYDKLGRMMPSAESFAGGVNGTAAGRG